MKRKRVQSTQVGVVLIMVLAVLTLLVILGWAFVNTARIERSVSRSYSDLVRARLVAISGIERAIGEMQKMGIYTDPSDAWVYYGEDLNKNGELNLLEDINKNGQLDTASLPLDTARDHEIRMSFQITDENYSGVLLSTYEEKGDFYQLKIIDCTNMININTPYQPILDPDKEDVLARILVNLGKAIDPDNPPIKDGDPSEGQMIVDYRDDLPNSQFATKEELKNLPFISEDDYERIEAYLTVNGWLDPSTVCLHENVGRPSAGAGCPIRYNYGAGDDFNLVKDYVLEEPRSPININLAEKPVLVAVLSDLKGIYLKPEDGAGLGRWYEASIDFDLAGTIADEIIKQRAIKPFKTWNDFNDFCEGTDDSLGDLGIIDHYQAALLKANFNPNADLNKFNPNQSFFRGTDKFDVEDHSTEFCFGSMGYFEVTCIGNVTKGGKVFASCQIDCAVKLWDVWRQTSHKDFYAGSTISSATAGISTHNAQSLQIYPEPDYTLDDGTSLPADAFFDGQVMLATTTTSEEDRLFRGGYSRKKKDNSGFDAFDANEAKGNKTMSPDIRGPNLDSVLCPTRLGGLFPDGVYVEDDEVLGYEAPGNVAPTIGAITMWLKPNWELPIGHHHFTSLASPPPGYTGDYSETMLFHFLYVHGSGAHIQPYGDANFWDCLAFHFEGNPGDTNQRCIGHNEATGFFQSHQWVHLAIAWNFAEMGDYNKAGRIYVNGNRLYCISRNDYKIGGGGAAEDISYYHGYTNILRLGERQNMQLYGGTPGGTPDGTLDEYTVYGDMKSDAFMLSQYNIGRYYSGGDAEFKSYAWKPILSSYTDNTAKIGTISWTEYNPYKDEFPTAFTFKVINKTTKEESAEFSEPGGNQVGLVANAGDEIQYQFTCEVYSDVDPLVDTPVLDDVTITIIKNPEYLSWYMH